MLSRFVWHRRDARASLTTNSRIASALNMRSKRVVNASSSATRDAISRAAARRFAEHGIEQTTIRQIVLDAGISLGTINFHFGSKEGLAVEVFEAHAKDVCNSRHAEFDRLKKATKGGPLALKAILRAVVRPYVEGDEDRRRLLIYILQQLKILKQEFARESVGQYFDGVAGRTVELLREARPHLPENEIWWRYTLGLGAVLSVVSDCGLDNRLKRLSSGVADASDRAQLLERAIDFWARGFGPALRTPKTRVAATSRSAKPSSNDRVPHSRRRARARRPQG